MDRHLALSRARAFRAFVGHLQPSLLLSSSSCFSYKCRTFQDCDLDSVRELFTIGMGMYTEGKSKETSSLYKFWWDYINGALAADLASDKKGGQLEDTYGMHQTHVYEGVGAPNQCPLGVGSKPPLPLFADVRHPDDYSS